MITLNKFDAIHNTDGTVVGDIEYRGLSTDTKPTENVVNGSAYIEIDTGKVYLFDATGETWNEI